MSQEKIFAAAGSRIAELRGAMSQATFASRLGVDRKTVVRWEAGERLPDGSSLLQLATEFGADVNYILTGQRSQPVPESASLPPRQRALLDNYENAPEAGKRVIEQTASFAAQPAASRRA